MSAVFRPYYKNKATGDADMVEIAVCVCAAVEQMLTLRLCRRYFMAPSDVKEGISGVSGATVDQNLAHF